MLRTFAVVLSLAALQCASAKRWAADGGEAETTQPDAGHSAAAGSGSGSTECRGPGRYAAGKGASYVPCCDGFTEQFYRQPGYTGDGTVKVCTQPPLRLYACVRGVCGDGVCEAEEAADCGCVADCPEAAWEDPVDAGASSEPSCSSATSPCRGANSFCTRGEIATRIADCVNRPLTPYYEVRCGPYDGVVSQGTDSLRFFYYDDAGKLVGTNDVGLSAQGCVAYDPSFMLPASCEITTPGCEDAGTG